MPFINLQGNVRLHFQDHNPSGERTVLLLHGLGVHGGSWGLQIPSLIQDGFRTLAPDVRGFGLSSYPGGSTSIAQMSLDMVHFMEELGVHHACVVGISMGGTIALHLAVEYPELVERLILTNTFACLRPKNPKLWFYYLLRLLMVHTLGIPAQARLVAKRLFPRPDQENYRLLLVEQISQADPRGYRAAIRALARFDLRDRLVEVRSPTLVITGNEDSTVPEDIQRQLAEAIAGARQVTIPHAGHAVNVEKPEKYSQ